MRNKTSINRLTRIFPTVTPFWVRTKRQRNLVRGLLQDRMRRLTNFGEVPLSGYEKYLKKLIKARTFPRVRKKEDVRKVAPYIDKRTSKDYREDQRRLVSTNRKRYARLKQLRTFYGNLPTRQWNQILYDAFRNPLGIHAGLFHAIEARLDVAITRMKWCIHAYEAHKWIRHGYIAVNGVKIFQPRYSLKAGDIITLESTKFRHYAVNRFKRHCVLARKNEKGEKLPRPFGLKRPYTFAGSGLWNKPTNVEIDYTTMTACWLGSPAQVSLPWNDLQLDVFRSWKIQRRS